MWGRENGNGVRKKATMTTVVMLLLFFTLLTGRERHGLLGKRQVTAEKCALPEALVSEDAVLHWISQEQMEDRDTWQDEATGREAQPDYAAFADFAPIQVEDDGRALTYDERYTGLVCRLGDELYERRDIVQADGSIEAEKVRSTEINGAWISVPQWVNRAFGACHFDDFGRLLMSSDTASWKRFGLPLLSVGFYADGKWDSWGDWGYIAGSVCPELNEGVEAARERISRGYLQEQLEEFLMHYPEIDPAQRSYTLELTGGGRVQGGAGTRWWELYYVLTTTAENGEVVHLADIVVDKQIDSGYLTNSGEVIYIPATNDACCDIYAVSDSYPALVEGASGDTGEVWVTQIPGMDFTDAEQIRSYVEAQGGDFDLLLPPGVGREITWDCHKEQGYWYEYLIWSGVADTYEITLAIPIMEEGSGGWYMASRIRRESRKKDACYHTLSVITQTFHASDYVHVVRKDETLLEIYEKYKREDAEEGDYDRLLYVNDIHNADLIYVGQEIAIPWV